MKATIGRDVNGRAEVRVDCHHPVYQTDIIERFGFKIEAHVDDEKPEDNHTYGIIIRSFKNCQTGKVEKEVIAKGTIDYCLARLFKIALRVNESFEKSMTLGMILNDEIDYDLRY